MSLRFQFYDRTPFSPPEKEEECRKNLEEAIGDQGAAINIPPSTFFEPLGAIIYPALEKIDPDLNNRSKFKTIVECLWEYYFPLPFYDVEGYADELRRYLGTFLKKDSV